MGLNCSTHLANVFATVLDAVVLESGLSLYYARFVDDRLFITTSSLVGRRKDLLSSFDPFYLKFKFEQQFDSPPFLDVGLQKYKDHAILKLYRIPMH